MRGRQPDTVTVAISGVSQPPAPPPKSPAARTATSPRQTKGGWESVGRDRGIPRCRRRARTFGECSGRPARPRKEARAAERGPHPDLPARWDPENRSRWKAGRSARRRLFSTSPWRLRRMERKKGFVPRRRPQAGRRGPRVDPADATVGSGCVRPEGREGRSSIYVAGHHAWKDPVKVQF